MDGLLEKAWAMLTVLVGGVVSLFLYKKKKDDEWKESHDRRLDGVEVEQARYGQTVLHIHERITITNTDIKELKELLRDITKDNYSHTSKRLKPRDK